MQRPLYRRPAFLVLVVSSAVLIASIAVFQGAALRHRGPGSSGPAMYVEDISLSIVQTNESARLTGDVLIRQGPRIVRGALVKVTITLPNGSRIPMQRLTNGDGIATFTQFVEDPGTYQLTVDDVLKRRAQYDRGKNRMSSAAVEYTGDADSPTPNPTATPTDPTPDEPTATPTDPAPPTATPTDPNPPVPTATATDPDPGPQPDEQQPTSYWHAPTDHEHGDAPPGWANDFSMANFGHPVGYGGDEQTPGEDANKHNFFKGFLTTLDGVDIYFRNHMDATPLSHQARFHSYEIYARDQNGNVSFWQGWSDFGAGNMTLPTVRDGGCEDDTIRPIMAVNKYNCGDYRFESWYSSPSGTGPNSGWVWDTGVNIEARFYHDGPGVNPSDPSTWIPAPDGNQGLVRRVELAWYEFRSDDVPRDTFFWATQWGTPVSGPNDPICGTQRTFGNKSYETKCLQQYIASSMTQVSFPGNSEQKKFPGPDDPAPNPTPRPTEPNQPTATPVPPTPTEPNQPTATPVPPTATQTATSPPDPTATPVPPTATPTEPDSGDGPIPSFPDVDPSSYWHPPGTSGPSGNAIHGHEHGDAPPSWANAFSMEHFGHPVGFGGDESTPGEDAKKHPGFKGYHTHFNGGEQYFRMHMMTTPLGESGVFHSLEVYMKDPSGNVSFLQGWVDFAAGNEGVTYLETPQGCNDPNLRPSPSQGRPRMGVNSLYCYENFGIYNFTSWYSDFHPILPETGINSQDTFFHDGDPKDPSTWTVNPDGNLGLVRRIEATWSPSQAPGTGWFYATQFGQIVSGPDDPVCGTQQVHQQQSHTVKCLPQYVANTAISLGFPGNAQQFNFPGNGVVELPN